MLDLLEPNPSPVRNKQKQRNQRRSRPGAWVGGCVIYYTGTLLQDTMTEK